MAKLKKAVKKKWVEALRSGDYEQGAGALCENGRFCCLGVLCEVAIDSGLDVKTREGSAVVYDGSVAFLPSTVYKWATVARGRNDWTTDFEVVPKGGYAISLSHLNDSGHSFAEIADLIEEHL